MQQTKYGGAYDPQRSSQGKQLDMDFSLGTESDATKQIMQTTVSGP